MANPENLEDYQFGITYDIVQGDPEDPNVDWDTMSVVNGSSENGLSQSQSQYDQIKDMIDSGTQSGVRNIKLVYAPKVAWREWEQEATDGTPSEEGSGEG